MFTWWGLYRSVPYEEILEDVSKNLRFNEATMVADVMDNHQEDAEGSDHGEASDDESRSTH
jgi:hypothetical protein